jgi:AcrR family transcriptional regulator
VRAWPPRTVEIILDTAWAVFETYGVRRANIEDVAVRAGVGRSTIYRRFPTKDDLFEKVVRREAETFFTPLDRATIDRNPEEAVIEAFALGVRLVHDSPSIHGSSKASPSYPGCFPDRTSSRLANSPTELPTPCADAGSICPMPTWPTSPTSCCVSRLASSFSPPTDSTHRIPR